MSEPNSVHQSAKSLSSAAPSDASPQQSVVAAASVTAPAAVETADTQQRKFTACHQWLEHRGNGVYRLGVAEDLQAELQAVFTVELPEVGQAVSQGSPLLQVCCSAGCIGLNAPLSGKVVALNLAVQYTPQLINRDCYGKGWLVEIQASDTSELACLMDDSDYRSSMARREQ